MYSIVYYPSKGKRDCVKERELGLTSRLGVDLTIPENIFDNAGQRGAREGG